MKQCFEEMKKEDRKAGRRQPGPPGGMCLFKCFVEKAGFVDDNGLVESKILQSVQSSSYGKSNAADWVNVIQAAVPRAFSDYSNMTTQLNLNHTYNETAKDCSPANGYFLSRLNAELYVVSNGANFHLIQLFEVAYIVFFSRTVQTSTKIHRNVLATATKSEIAQYSLPSPIVRTDQVQTGHVFNLLTLLTALKALKKALKKVVQG